MTEPATTIERHPQPSRLVHHWARWGAPWRALGRHRQAGVLVALAAFVAAFALGPTPARLALAVVTSVGAAALVRADRQRRTDRQRLAARLIDLRRSRVLYRSECRRQTEAAAEAQAAAYTRSAFLAQMCHEIRTPMNGILGLTELALGTETDPSQQDLLLMLRSSADSMVAILDDILDFSRIDSGQLLIATTPFEPRQILSDIMRSLGLKADQRGIELVCDASCRLPRLLFGDPVRLRQALLSLTAAAIRRTKSGDVVLQTGVATRRDQLYLDVTIADTGTPVSRVILEAITNPFTPTNTSGAGVSEALGASISARLIQLMGGQIDLQSEPGRGNVCRFSVPVAPADCAPADVSLKLHGSRILVVDDNLASLAMLDRALRGWGAQTGLASNAQEALRLIRDPKTEPFHAALVDASMPGQDGLDLAETIQLMPPLEGPLPIILMSGPMQLPRYTKRSRELGLHQWLLKPVIGSGLEDVISFGSPSPEQRFDEVDFQRRYRILIAEDDPVNQRVLQAILEQRGHRVVLASNGLQALQSLENESFDAVLMDLVMPEMNGYETTAAIREIDSHQGGRTTIVALTAVTQPAGSPSNTEADFDAYLTKPVQAAQVLDTLARLLEPAAVAF